ncbi:hypothetical protein CRYUN_Cryun11dG0151000 [Craigia yunnanensis]
MLLCFASFQVDRNIIALKSMEGKNKRIEKEIPASVWPKNSIDVRPFSFMSPSNLPLAPSSFHVRKKPYFMNNVGAGSSCSRTKTCFFQASDPLSMKGENNNETDENPSSQSDQNLTLETSAGDNSVETEVGNGVQVRLGRILDPNMDPRMLKRALSNRLSAQKSRIKKLQYVFDMERKVESLETLIAVLSPQVALYTDKKYFLQMEQKNLNQRMTACDNQKIIVDAEIEERRAEVDRLRQLYLTQQLQKMQEQTRMDVWEHGLTEEMVNPGLNQSGIGLQPMYDYSNQGKLN